MRAYPKDSFLVAVKQPAFDDKLREEGLSYAELARRSGVSRSMISAFASSKKCMTASTLLRLANVAPWLLKSGQYWDMVTPEEWNGVRAHMQTNRREVDRYLNVQINEAVLRDTLVQKGWSLKDCARQAGVSLQTLYNVCSGRTRPKMSTIKALTAALGVSQDELFVAVYDSWIPEQEGDK